MNFIIKKKLLKHKSFGMHLLSTKCKCVNQHRKLMEDKDLKLDLFPLPGLNIYEVMEIDLQMQIFNRKFNLKYY